MNASHAQRANSFASLSGVSLKGTKGTCPRCTQRKKAGIVTLGVLEDENGDPKQRHSVKGRQVGLCEPCAVQVFVAMLETLEAVMAGPDR